MKQIFRKLSVDLKNFKESVEVIVQLIRSLKSNDAGKRGIRLHNVKLLTGRN